MRNTRFKVTGIYIFTFMLLLTGSIKAQNSPISYAHPEEPPTMQELMKWKEVFTYKVTYSFFTLGKVYTTVVRDTTYQGNKLWWLRTKIISNSSIPFMGKENNHYNTFFVETDSTPYTRLYWRDNVDEEDYNDERYDFDYKARKLYIYKDHEPSDTLELDEPSTAGQLIFYYSRLFAGTDQQYKLPVYTEGEKGYIDVQNTTKTERREYEAFDYPINTYFTSGNAHIDGPFGFNGKFKAWFITDDLRIPAEVHAKVWLGNVKVRLTDYKKSIR